MRVFGKVLRLAAVSGTALLLALQPASAQYTLGTGVEFQSFDFDEGLGADRAQLLMIPVAVRIPVRALNGLAFDIYSAWADGRVQVEDEELKLTGPIDTGVRAGIQATPWALVTVGVNIPTGAAQHDSEEAIVASVMSS
ncbi:MAG: hypothetical protein PVI31_09035, partial [Gemmatimonadota bacterium]